MFTLCDDTHNPNLLGAGEQVNVLHPTATKVMCYALTA